MGLSPERRDLEFGILLIDLDGETGETGTQMLEGQEGVIEVQRGDLIGHFGIVGTAGVTVAQDDVVEPVWDDALGVHQVPDGLQHRLERKPTAGKTTQSKTERRTEGNKVLS